MPELQLLRVDHAPALLEFELANRAYFTASISDRGDDYFEHFAEQLDTLLADQAAGSAAFYVLIDDDSSVLGRFNLQLGADAVAVLGYRVAQRASGQGLATATVLDLAGLAAERHGVHRLRAATTDTNRASQRVLIKAGFAPVGRADPAEIGGNSGTWYEREVVAS